LAESIERVKGGRSRCAQLDDDNIHTGAFYLLPAIPMDGGRRVAALLATRLSYARDTQVAANVGQGFASSLFIGLL